MVVPFSSSSVWLPKMAQHFWDSNHQFFHIWPEGDISKENLNSVLTELPWACYMLIGLGMVLVNQSCGKEDGIILLSLECSVPLTLGMGSFSLRHGWLGRRVSTTNPEVTAWQGYGWPEPGWAWKIPTKTTMEPTSFQRIEWVFSICNFHNIQLVALGTQSVFNDWINKLKQPIRNKILITFKTRIHSPKANSSYRHYNWETYLL